MPLNVLVIGCYRDGGSGYARAAADNIMALDAAGANVVCRPLCLGPAVDPVYPELAEFETRRLPYFDAVLQHIPPYAMHYCAEAGVNVGAFYFETHPIPSPWVSRACLMDTMMLPCDEMVEQFKSLPHYEPRMNIFKMPIPSNVNRYECSYKPVPKFEAYKDGGRFLFYTIGEFVRRKNFSGLLRAYYAEFRQNEPVGLVVKASLMDKTPEEVNALVAMTCQEVMRGMKIHNTPPVFIVSDRLPEEQLMALHLACDCFVQPSMGEGWSIPAFDALAFGKTPIVTDAGGYKEYLDDSVAWMVPGRREPVFAEGDVHADLFTGRQTWCAPDLLHLRKCMRQAYEEKSFREEKASRGLARACDFSYEAIGPQLMKALAQNVRQRVGSI